ncbi:intercompartmental signaling factor BofC [Bacillus massiliglaciei]|uniref:intercompartmental signaling factor BofC n=1 Tax=Bacillus massiliglaciei TaxID=1816693 RepID=UPI0018FE0D80|nr:intercompartmental signaling factor BofC [Bacillus massiliglaciei]
MKSLFLWLTAAIILIPVCWNASAEETIKSVMGPTERKVILQRMYLDGEQSEEKVTETIWAMEDFWAKYKDWKLIDQNEKEIIFQKREQDISPLLKANGYFGMTEEGVISIYNGKPKYDKIIQSFFQVDVGQLEAYKKEELQRGIPILNKDQFQKLIKSYEPYTKN